RTGAAASGSFRAAERCGSEVNDGPADRQSRTVTEPSGEECLQRETTHAGVFSLAQSQLALGKKYKG
ncbi:MAG: hypothetical protein Q4A88_04120, partial [Clostridia bacterium]|nr:hypothetical protein [Clostridia bacterium]